MLQKKPFIPKHEKKYTEPKNMRLNTERRAKEWMVFEQEIKEKFSHYEEMLRLVNNAQFYYYLLFNCFLILLF